MQLWAKCFWRLMARRLLLVPAALGGFNHARSETVRIEMSGTIDAAGSLPSAGVDIGEGTAGPISVRLVAGAEVATLSGSPSFVRDHSLLTIDGGAIGGPVDAYQQATVQLVSGSFDYSRSRDAFWLSDLPAAVRLHDESTMRSQGGSIDLIDPSFMLMTSAIEARDQSRVYFEAGKLISWAADTVRLSESAEMQVSGGHIESLDHHAIHARGRSTVRIAAGTIVGGEGGSAIQLDDQSRLELSGGTLLGDEALGIVAEGESVGMVVNATIHVSDATGVLSGGNSRLTVVSSAASYNECCFARVGQTGTLRLIDNRGGGEVSVVASGRGRLVLVGNRLGGTIGMEGQSTTDLLSGVIVESERNVLSMKDDATLNLRGGVLQRVGEALEDGIDVLVAGRANLNVYAWSPTYRDGKLGGQFRDGTLINLEVNEVDDGRVLLYDLKAIDYAADLTMDGRDIDRMGRAIRDPTRVDWREFQRYDLDGSGMLDRDDLETMLQTYLGVDFGDMNLDGYFDSTDLIDALAAGFYDRPVEAGWSSGDWNQDTRFDSTDLLIAFQTGNYVASHGLPPDAPIAPSPMVPEPSGAALGFGMAVVICAASRR